MQSSRMRYCFSFVFLVLCCSGGSAVHAQSKELTVEDYCRLTISLMQISVDEWQERIPAAEKIKTDRKKLESALQTVTRKYRDQRTDALKQFGIDHGGYLRYGTDHKTEIDSYLEENLEVQQSIDDLKNQIHKLIEQFESLTSPREEGAEK